MPGLLGYKTKSKSVTKQVQNDVGQHNLHIRMIVFIYHSTHSTHSTPPNKKHNEGGAGLICPAESRSVDTMIFISPWTCISSTY